MNYCVVAPVFYEETLVIVTSSSDLHINEIGQLQSISEISSLPPVCSV